MPIAWTVSDNLKVPSLMPLAVGTVKHVGDVVAVVAATSKDAADDGWKRLQEWFKKHGAA